MHAQLTPSDSLTLKRHLRGGSCEAPKPENQGGLVISRPWPFLLSLCRWRTLLAA